MIQPFEQVATGVELQKLKDWIYPAIWDLGVYQGKLYGLAM